MTNNISLLPKHCGSDDGAAAPIAPDPRMLLSSMVHDFNIFLTPIVSVLEEMQVREAGTARQLKKIDGAIYCAFRAKTLARQLLEFASPRPVKLAAVDIRRVLDGIKAPLASLLSTRICLDLIIADNLPKAFIDQQLIERALLNLVLNARDAMPAGGHVTITVAQDYQSIGDNPMIRLTIADSGTGMDEATLKMAGEPFYSTKTNGTGLGLAIVRQAMERQGGGLSIASKHHRGTTIDLWLPVMSASSAD